MTRKLMLLLVMLCSAALVASASQTMLQVQIFDVPPVNPGTDQYTAAVPDTGYAGVRTQVRGGSGTVNPNYANDPENKYTGFSSTVDYLNSGAYCVDPDQVWTQQIKDAYLTTLDDAVALDNVNTKLGRGTERNYTTNTGSSGNLTAQARYQMATYLTTFLDASTTNIRGAIWGAIWTFTDVVGGPVDIPGTAISDLDSVIAGANTDKEYWIARARDARINNDAGYNAMQWQSYVLISQYTNSAPYFQEFVTQIPEPGAYALMGTAFLGVFLVVRRNRRMSKQVEV